jgi:hypothetical protein
MLQQSSRGLKQDSDGWGRVQEANQDVETSASMTRLGVDAMSTQRTQHDTRRQVYTTSERTCDWEARLWWPAAQNSTLGSGANKW